MGGEARSMGPSDSAVEAGWRCICGVSRVPEDTCKGVTEKTGDDSLLC